MVDASHNNNWRENILIILFPPLLAIVEIYFNERLQRKKGGFTRW